MPGSEVQRAGERKARDNSLTNKRTNKIKKSESNGRRGGKNEEKRSQTNAH